MSALKGPCVVASISDVEHTFWHDRRIGVAAENAVALTVLRLVSISGLATAGQWQVSNEHVDLFAHFIDPYQQRLDKALQEEKLARKTNEINAAFVAKWVAVYRNENDEVDLCRNPQVIADRLLSLVEGIESRFWDFRIPHLINTSDRVGYNLACSALLLACKRDRDGLISGLSRSIRLDFYADISFWHGDILSSLNRQDLPFTPKMTQTALAKLLGVERHAIDNARRAGKLKFIVSQIAIGRKRQSSARQWKHQDDTVQRQILEKIRKEKCVDLLDVPLRNA